MGSFIKGEEPGWIAGVLGHKDLSMVYTVYAKYILGIHDDGKKFDEFFS